VSPASLFRGGDQRLLTEMSIVVLVHAEQPPHSGRNCISVEALRCGSPWASQQGAHDDGIGHAAVVDQIQRRLSGIKRVVRQ